MFGKRGKYEAVPTEAAQNYKKKSVKSNLLSAYFTSLLCLILCATMFLSTSMAWFTSEVNNSGNEIYVGMLDVKLLHENGGNWIDLEAVENQDYKILDNSILWQPNTLVVERLQVVNEGNLAFNYRLSMTINHADLTGDTKEAEIAKAELAASKISVWVKRIEPNVEFTQPSSYEAMVADTTWSNVGTLAEVFEGKLVIQGAMGESEAVTVAEGTVSSKPTAHDYAIALHMDADVQEDVMGAKLTGINIKLIASQLDGDVLYIPVGETVTLNGATHPVTVYGEGTLALNNVTINGTEMHPNALTIAGNITVDVQGKTTLTGAACGSGIYVNEGATLTLTGPNVDGITNVDNTTEESSLTVIGNKKTDDDNGGHGIGGEGTIVINGVTNLTAEGYGKNGFGIGGNAARITISNTTITYAKGGYVQPNFVKDTSYGKTEPEGGAAIGSGHNGAVINLTNVVIEKAEGGSKAAGIGAKFWTGVTINIKDCNIKNVIGGNASAGIGGSRISEGATTVENVTINITDSNIVATGGQFGAGIGSGYDTYCQGPGPVCEINIKGTNNYSITAQGGQYAAGIGTGYHVAGLAGKIEGDVIINATAGGNREKYTVAMAVGFGVIDHSREANSDNQSKFDYKGTVITVASAPLVNGTTDE